MKVSSTRTISIKTCSEHHLVTAWKIVAGIALVVQDYNKRAGIGALVFRTPAGVSLSPERCPELSMAVACVYTKLSLDPNSIKEITQNIGVLCMRNCNGPST